MQTAGVAKWPGVAGLQAPTTVAVTDHFGDHGRMIASDFRDFKFKVWLSAAEPEPSALTRSATVSLNVFGNYSRPIFSAWPGVTLEHTRGSPSRCPCADEPGSKLGPGLHTAGQASPEPQHRKSEGPGYGLSFSENSLSEQIERPSGFHMNVNSSCEYALQPAVTFLNVEIVKKIKIKGVSHPRTTSFSF
jgi:hypothetical protein